MFDCHIHSSFSTDSNMSIDLICEKSIDLGLEGIALTDHFDHDYPGHPEEFNIDFNQYAKNIELQKTKYSSRLKIIKGIEVGFQPHAVEITNNLLKNNDFDFVIGSVHIIDRFDPYDSDDYFTGKTKEEAYIRYLEEIYASITKFTNFDVIGHIGYIRRYGNFDDRSMRFSDYKDILDIILKEAVSKGKGIEINSSGYKDDILKSPIPDFDLVKRYKELGGEIICTGSDAHKPEHIALNFEYIYNKLKEIGFKYTAHFENRKPVFDLLK